MLMRKSVGEVPFNAKNGVQGVLVRGSVGEVPFNANNGVQGVLVKIMIIVWQKAQVFPPGRRYGNDKNSVHMDLI